MLRIDKRLREAVMDRVEVEWERGGSIKRRNVIREVLAQFVRAGDAERYYRRDGHVAWRPTAKFNEWLKEGEWETEEFDNA